MRQDCIDECQTLTVTGTGKSAGSRENLMKMKLLTFFALLVGVSPVVLIVYMAGNEARSEALVVALGVVLMYISAAVLMCVLDDYADWREAIRKWSEERFKRR